MRLLLLTTLLLLLPIGAQVRAELVEIYFENPGAGGMQSNYGIHTLNPDQLYFQYNVDTWTTPGVIMRRKGLQNYGNNSVALFGAHGYYNNTLNHNMIVGIVDDTTLNGICRVSYSDTNATDLSAGVLASPLTYIATNYRHDWVALGDVLIHANANSMPSVFTSTCGVKQDQGNIDKEKFGPRILPMNLHQPGQPYVQIYDTLGYLSGKFVYAFSYGGGIGPQSEVVDLLNQQVIISGIPYSAGDILRDTLANGSSDSSAFYVYTLRKKQTGTGRWMLVDSVYRPQDSGLSLLPFIDNVPFAGIDTTWYCTDTSAVPDTSYTIVGCDTCGSVVSWYKNGAMSPTNTYLSYPFNYTFVGIADSQNNGQIDVIPFGIDSITPEIFLWEECSSGDSFTVEQWVDRRPIGTFYGQYDSVVHLMSHSLVNWGCIDSANAVWDSIRVDSASGAPTDTTWFYTDGTVDSLNVCDTCGGLVYWSSKDNVTAFSDRTGLCVGCQKGCPGSPEYSLDSITGDYHFWAWHWGICGDSFQVINNLGATSIDCQGVYSKTLADWVCATDTLSYFDSVTTRYPYDSVVIDTTTFEWDRTGGYVPGSPWRDTLVGSTNSSCRVAYAWYDPLTGLESPLGPSVACVYDTETKSIKDSLLFRDYVNHVGARWIRIYQTVVNPLVAGGGDTTVWRGVIQGRMNGEIFNDALILADSTYNYFPMNWSDTALANGLDSADVPDTLDYPYHFFYTALGDVVVKPPYIYGCQVSFTDMEYTNNRLFGIGDPIAPEVLYFSEPNTWYTNVWNWPPFNYLEINEGVTGKLIAIERAEGYGRDALYVFKRNAIYLVDFSSGQSVQLIESNIGPVSKEAIVKVGKTVFFLASDMQIYALYGQTVQPIADGVRNWIDTLFTSEIDAAEDCRAFRLGKSVKWFNSDATDVTGGLGLAFYPNALTTTGKGAWSLESYGDDSAYIPLGSFSYDSTSGGIMSGFPTTVTYSATAVPLRTQADSVGLTLRTDVGASRFPTGFKFPFVGDGLNFWSPSSMDFTIIVPTTGTGLDYLRLEWRVVDEKGNVLAADSINVAATSAYSVDFAQVTTTATTGKWLSLWLRTDSDATISGYDMYNHFELRDLRFWIKDEGRSNVY